MSNYALCISSVTYCNRFLPQLYRILDANLDRAREGLRVIEEWCRFGLENQDLSGKCKHWRQELAKWHTPQLRQARDTAHDPGTQLHHDQEAHRPHIDAVLQANLARVQEALRVLEEYSKIYNGQMSLAMKEMRYQVYILESQLLVTNHRSVWQEALLYLVTMPVPNIVEIVENALQGGLRLVQFRQKEGDDRQRIATAQKLCDLCHEYNAVFLVNDRVDFALAVGADGVHLGQDDLTVAQARSILGSQAIIGLSTTSPTELEAALAQNPDYVGVGPVYATPTKPGKAPAGHSYVAYAAQNCPIPWYAIGGVDRHNLPEVLGMGAQRVAVVRSVMQASNPQEYTIGMNELLAANLATK